MAAPKFVQARVTSLLISITESETTEIKLKNLVDAYGNALSMTDFGDTGYVTIDPGSDSEEIISFTGFTVNSDSTVSIDTGITRALVAVSPYGSGGTASAHAAGARVVVSNNPQMYDAIIDYIDSIALAGVSDADETTKGVVEQATQAEVDAKTEEGATGAKLFVSPDLLRTQLYNDYVADTGAADAYEIAPSPAITAYAAGQVFTFKASAANTGASTVDVNSLGAKAIKKDVSTALAAGDILASQIVTVVYDGTNMQLLSAKNEGTLVNDVQEFTSSGTWTKPSGDRYKSVFVQIWGAGGGGGGGTHAGGGGGGGYAEELFDIDDLGATETVTIGSGGAGGSGDGTVGGNSTFGSHLTAYGGGGGASDGSNAGGGGGGGPLSVGGSTTSTTAGAAGQPGSPVAGLGGSGASTEGGGAGLFGGGGASKASLAYATGGGAYYGGGGGGNGYTGSTGGTSVRGGNGGGFGAAGTQPGGGGGGHTSSGGAGAAGMCIVTTF